MLMSRAQPEIRIQLWGWTSVSASSKCSQSRQRAQLQLEPEGWAPLMPMRHQKLREGQISLKVTQQVEGPVWT